MSIADISKKLVSLVQGAGRFLVRIDGGHRGTPGFVHGDGLVVTSSRALRRDEDLRGAIGSDEVELELVGRDPGTDVAVLRYAADGGAAAQPPAFRDAASLEVGEMALAVARPGHGVRAALGILGVLGDRFRGPGGAPIGRYVELDRPLARGFSGGALLDAQGRVIGMITRALVRGAALTIPGPTLARVVDEIQNHGYVPRGHLGVGVYPARLPAVVARGLGQERGVVIVALEEDGPAAKAGVVVGDVVIAVDQVSIESPLALRAALLDRGGNEIRLRVLRAGQTHDLKVRVGARG